MLEKLSLLVALAPLVACASQVDSSHQGTALAKIEGEIRNTRTQPLTSNGAEVVAVWLADSGSGDITVAESVDVSGSFPAQFSLSIYEPPMDTLLNDLGGVKIGLAFIIAGVPGTDYSDRASARAGMLGMEENHVLVYVPQDVPAGSRVSLLLRGTPTAGFHLYGVHKLTDAEREARSACIDELGPEPTLDELYSTCGGPSTSNDDLVPLATDLQTPLEINLVDDVSQIDGPNLN